MKNKRDRLKYSLVLAGFALVLAMGAVFAKSQSHSISLNSPASFPVDI